MWTYKNNNRYLDDYNKNGNICEFIPHIFSEIVFAKWIVCDETKCENLFHGVYCVCLNCGKEK